MAYMNFFTREELYFFYRLIFQKGLETAGSKGKPSFEQKGWFVGWLGGLFVCLLVFL